MEEHVGKTVRRMENDSSVTVMEALQAGCVKLRVRYECVFVPVQYLYHRSKLHIISASIKTLPFYGDAPPERGTFARLEVYK